MTSGPRTSDEIRQAFLDFFRERGHVVLPPWPLVPIGDPTSLFTTAGMQQFKPVLAGEQPRPAVRAATVQRVFRTTDIEEVGDLSHLTAFEMLGNFSFGDYYKKEAIAWAWELLTRVYAIPADRLHMTIFLDDEDAYRLWRQVGVADDHIHRRDEDLNFWFSFAAGGSGPCGPDSEIYFDHFPERGPVDRAMPLDLCAARKLGVGYDDRFLEIWNLVFMELYQHPDGTRTPLPNRNIDTGSGLERVAAVLQGKTSVYETDIFRPILERAAQVAGVDYFGPGATAEQTYAVRAMAEHCRAAALLVGDGVVPGNEGRGYVLRRILRRAIYFARSIGVDEPFTARVAGSAIEKLGAAYPHLQESRSFILRALQAEEERFVRTLGLASQRLTGVLQRMRQAGLSEVPAADAFLLYDTYGLPLELIVELAGHDGFTVDSDGFEVALEEQRARARRAGRFFAQTGAGDLKIAGEHSAFVGYHHTLAEGQVVALLSSGAARDLAVAGEEVELVLDVTPFYPEGGGQVGDRGNISTPTAVIAIEDTQARGGAILHRGRVLEGEVRVAQSAQATVDVAWRAGAARNHTGTHLLHASLRAILGAHVRQQGSLVAPDRLRFDFTHLEQTAPGALAEVQRLANDRIREDLEVSWRTTTYRKAIEGGALAFFGDKYGAEVRVVEIGGEDGAFSAELCGGTHVHHTGEIGFVHILRESAVAAGTRRLEALTGKAAEAHLLEVQATLARVAERLNTTPAALEDRIQALEEELQRLRKQNQALERFRAAALVDSLLASAIPVDGAHLIVARVEAHSAETLRELADRLRARLKPSLLVLGAEVEGQPAFLAAATADLVERGVHAGNLVREVAKAAGGGGGGRPDMAQAGAKDLGRLDPALEQARKLARSLLAGLGA